MPRSTSRATHNAGKCHRCRSTRRCAGGAGRCWAVPGGAGRCREVPGGTVPGGAGRCRAVPGGAGRCRAVPGGAGRCRAVPGGAWRSGPPMRPAEGPRPASAHIRRDTTRQTERDDRTDGETQPDGRRDTTGRTERQAPRSPMCVLKHRRVQLTLWELDTTNVHHSISRNGCPSERQA